MSSTLRLSIIAVMLLATTMLGLIAYTAMHPKAAPISVQAAPLKPIPPWRRTHASAAIYLVTKHPLPEGTLVRDPYLRPGQLTEAHSGAFTPSDESKLRGALIRKPIDAGKVITSQDVMLRDDPGYFAALAKLCQDDNNRQTTTVKVYRNGKAEEYSVKKTDTKAGEACIELDAAYPANKVVER
jgi:Flp pilus assembly protein CpaB